jgi:TonB-dependent starch-binding outer membrane protein SusC
MKLILTLFSLLKGNHLKRLILTMKLCILISLLAVLNATASVYSQNKKISIKAEDVQLRDLFREIENNSEYAFFFSDQYAELDKKVTLEVNDGSINTIMDKLLVGTYLDYQILDNNFVVIKPKVSKQEISVRGTVVDANGNPIPGVKITIKGTAQGTLTDINGQFSLSVPSADAILVFESLTYNTEEITVGNQTAINLTLIESLEELDEVVVVGYGSMQRSNVAGSISSLKSDDIKKANTNNAIEALRGQIPGVRITRTSGDPSKDVTVTVRGKRSLGTTSDINASNYIDANKPLVVVDGVPYNSGNISDINPNDIASIDILKDAAATSVYGSSASNGVILITTKSGFSGKPSLSVNISTGYESFAQRPTMFDAEDYTYLKRISPRKSWDDDTILSVQAVLDPYEYQNYLDGKSIDWIDELTRTGRINQVGLSLNGGTDKFHYYLNGDVYSQDPVVYSSSYDRYSFRVNADYTPYKFITLGAKTSFTLVNADETGTFIQYTGLPDFGMYVGSSPLGRTRDSLGNLVPTVNSDQFQYNMFYKFAHSDIERKNSRSSIEPFLELRIVDGLTFRMNSFVEFRNERYTRYYDGMYDEQNLGRYTYRYNVGQGYNYLLDNILNYSKTFAEKHALNITAVYGLQSNSSENFEFNGQSVMDNYLGLYDWYNIDPSSDLTSQYNPDIYVGLSRKAYYVGRIVYGYDNRYIVTLSRRWDYSSQFGPKNRKGIFPSYALAWNISNEDFLSNNPTINNLKLRLSYGEVGNDRIAEFSYLPTADVARYSFGGTDVVGWTSQQAGNNNLHWETSKQINTGIDFGLYNHRLSGSFDYYKSRNVELLFSKQVPIIYGDQDPLASRSGRVMSNIGETESWGLEALLTGKILDGDFQWEATVNWSMDRNKIIKLGGEVDENGEPIDDLANGWYIGQDIDVNYTYRFDGIYQIADTAEARLLHPDKSYYGPGDPIIVDLDGNDTINEKDREFIGSRVTPKWYGGITNTFRFKGLELSILIETVQGIKKVNPLLPNPLSGIRGNSVEVDYWTLENPSNEYPRPRSGVFDYSDAVRLRDASFVCLRNVSLSYSLPHSLFQKVPIKGVTAYVRGSNLKYFTKYTQAYTPEAEGTQYPVTKNWTFGLNVTF